MLARMPVVLRFTILAVVGVLVLVVAVLSVWAEGRQRVFEITGLVPDYTVFKPLEMKRFAEAPEPVRLGVAAYNRQEFEEAFDHLMPLAEAGIAEAQYLIGRLHGEGYGVPRDDAKAALWIDKAVVQGYPKAILYKGIMVSNGTGYLQDYEQAVQLFRSIVGNKYANLYFELGRHLYDGLGKKHSKRAGLYYFDTSIMLGGCQALHYLARDFLTYTSGSFYDPFFDPARAKRYLELARERNCPHRLMKLMVLLGLHY